MAFPQHNPLKKKKKKIFCYKLYSGLSWGKDKVAYTTKPQQREKKKAKDYEEREIRSSLLILDLKMASCKIQESKKKGMSSINCMFHKLHVV